MTVYAAYAATTAYVPLLQVVLLKVYKEYDDSAWNLWRRTGRDKGMLSVEEWVYGDPEAIKAALKEAQIKHKEVRCASMRVRMCVCVCAPACACVCVLLQGSIVLMHVFLRV